MTNVIGTPSPEPPGHPSPLDRDVETVVCDLDGVVWLAKQPIPGAVDAVHRMRQAGCRVVFATNNSADVLDEHERSLEAIGIPARGDVISSAQAAARLVAPGERVAVVGGPGVIEALGERGAVIVDGAPCDAVVVGLSRTFDYDDLAAAAAAVRDGARLIGTNDDATYPTPDGPIPGAGSLLAAVETASGADPVVAGKPHQPMVDLALARLAIGDDPARRRSVLVVGDRPSTDGAFAAAMGCGFALVRTGVTLPGAPPAWDSTASDSLPDVVLDVADLAAVADAVVARRSG